jgi:rubrerythrin
MTKEERKKAIEVLDDMKVKIDIPKAAKTQNDRNWALDVAIQALSQEPCDDAISRAEAQTALMISEDAYLYIGHPTIRISDAVQAIRELPSVTHKSAKDYLDMADRKAKKIKDALTVTQKSGKWLITPMSNIAYCSECDYLFKDIPASVVEHFKHCPNCGAKMESEDNE